MSDWYYLRIPIGARVMEVQPQAEMYIAGHLD